MGYIVHHIIVFLISFYVTNSVWKYLQDDHQYCTIETTAGRVRGKQNRTLFEGKLFYSFRGIPYAKPPINELRFKAPEINDPWSGTLDAFDFANECFQHISGDTFVGFEDCLYLNVYVPTNSTSIDTNAKLPVVFYIYGGRFVTGASNYYAPDPLMEENVIFVIPNYRVGPFGFLSLNLPEYSGNMGLKDQSLALRWVNENIGNFGGDKNQITVAGHSSGSVSAHLHTISPHSNHLFKRAIMLSGAALSPFLSATEEQTTILYDLAKELNYSISNEYELIDFLNDIDVHLLLKKSFYPMYKPKNGSKVFNHGWTFVVEGHNAINPFLTESPFNILTSPNYKSNIDTIFSSSPREWVLFDEQVQPDLLQILDEVFEFELPLEGTNIDFNTQTYKNISKRIRDFYFDGKHVTTENLNQLHMLISDIIFTYGIDLSARIQAKKSNARTLFSRFTAENDWNYSARNRKESNFTITFDMHPDQLYYLLWFSLGAPNEIYQNLSENSLPRRIIKNTANFYANFVKYGNVMPNTDLAEFNVPESNEYKFYEISNNGVFLRLDKDRDRYDFWNNLFNDFRTHWNITFDFKDLK